MKDEKLVAVPSENPTSIKFVAVAPVTKEVVKTAVDELAAAVKIEQDAEAVLETVRKTYDAEFAAWLEDHLDIAGALDLAEEGYKAARIVKAGAENAVREIAPTYFADNPEARKETPGLSYRLERKPIIDSDFVMKAVKAGATILLQPDKAAIKKFTQGMATQNKITKLWSLPDSVLFWLDDSLRVKNDYVVTIAEDKLGASEPESEE